MTEKTRTDAACDLRGRQFAMTFRMPMLLTALIFLAGCTSINVRPLRYDANLKEIKLLDNPKVIVSDFVPVMGKIFAQHGITLRQVSESTRLGEKEYGIRYSAKRSWTVVPYLSQAYVKVYQGDAIVAEGTYELIGRSVCLSLYKWQGVETKMKPVYDELLKNYPPPDQKRP